VRSDPVPQGYGARGIRLNGVTVDGLGRLTDANETITKTDGNTVNHGYTYVYDMRSQLTDANITNIGGVWAADYAYHKSGNMSSRTIQSSSESFGVDVNMVWNWDNMLRSAEKAGDSISLRYDPSGNRIFKDVNDSGSTSTRKYIVDIVGDLPVILMEIDDSNDVVKKTYIYANSQILAQHDGNNADPRYFYLHDRLGSVRELIDTDANVVRMYTYEPFGKTLEEQGTLSNSFMFTGQWFDSEIDEYYLRARMYDSYLSRFTSRDPVFGKFEEPLSLHVYLYCINDPVNKIDLWGLVSVAVYDPTGEEGPYRGESADDYDYIFRVSSVEEAAFWVEIISGFEDVDDLYIFGHGDRGIQSLGDDVLSPRDVRWWELAWAVKDTGTIHLRGCNVASGPRGRAYIQELADWGLRSVDAFDNLVEHEGYPWFERNWYWGADYWSCGNLWRATPFGGEPEKVSDGSPWHYLNRHGRR